MSDLAFVEAVDFNTLARCEPAWRALSARASEPNVFAEPAFLLPALERLAPRRGVTMLLVWSDPARVTLNGIIALRKPRLGLARVWCSEQAGLAAMLWDRDAVARALGAALRWMRARGLAGAIWPGVEADGALGRAMHALAAREGLRLEVASPRRRAALTIADETSFESGLDRKRRKEWARQRRRLAERGRLETRVAADAGAIAGFLALEAAGWKGARGTALATVAGRREFAREMLEGFARDGTLAVHELTLDDAPIASGIVLRSGARAFYWKTAYDERFAEFSPGVQLTLALSRALAGVPGLASIDSCALENHPMIDRLWPGRLELVDIAVATAPGRAWRFAAWLAGERAISDAREKLKVSINRWRGRKRS